MKKPCCHNTQVLWLLLLLIVTSCTGDEADTLTTDGEGRLALGSIQVEVNVNNSPLTKGTPGSYDAPQPEALTYSITNTGTSESKDYSYSELMASPALAVGNYTLTATYGTESMGTTPYLYYSTSFTIQSLQTTTLSSFSIPLACAIIRPSITDLLPHFQGDVQLTLTNESGTSITVNNLTDYFVPAGKAYTLSIKGTNQLGETKTLQGSISLASARTRYILNCTADVPVFAMPEQADYNAWSYHIDFTPLTASQISDAAGISTDKILNNLIYEYSADGGNSWQAFTGTRLTNLTPNTTYTFRARFGAVYSTNQVTLTTEGAEPVPNGDFEDLVQTISVTEMLMGGKYKVSPKTYTPWCSFTVSEPKGWNSINNKTCNTNAQTPNTWFVIPSTYSTNITSTAHCPKVGISSREITPTVYDGLTAHSNKYAVVIRNVAWDANGTNPSTSGGAFNTKYYCTNIPSIANRSAGQLNLNTRYATRPTSLKGYFKYTRDGQDTSEMATVTVRLLNGSTEIGKGILELGAESSYVAFQVPISYSIFNQKATKLDIMITSSNRAEGNIKTTNYLGEYEAWSYGATLTIDNLTFTYD